MDGDAELIALYQKLGSFREVAARTGCNRHRLAQIVRAAKIPIRRRNEFTDSERERMVELYREEGSVVRAGERFGCSPTTIADACDRAGIELDGREKLALPAGTPPRWTRYTNKAGYVILTGWVPGKTRSAIILEHRLEMERHLGRSLLRHESVHHKNGIRSDNRIENLELRVGSHGSGATHCPHCGEKITL